MGARRLVGREAETAAWRGLRAQVEAGRGAALLMAGPAGVGKTALLREVSASVAADWHVLTAVGDAMQRDTPLGVVWPWFARLVQGAAAGESPFDGPARRVHEIVTAGPSSAARGDGRSTRDDPLHLAFSVAWCLRALAEERPVLLVVDDVQWCDPASVELVAALVPLLTADRVALVVGLREGDEGRSAEAVHALMKTVDLVRPAPLDVEAVRDWVVRELGPGPQGEAERVHEVTGGLPLLVEEVVEQMRLGPRDVARLPGPVLDVVAHRMDLLDPRHATVLTTVVVLADDARRAVVREVAEVSPAELAEAERLLAARRLVEADGDVLRVVHPLVAEAVVAAVEPAAVASLHARAAVVLDAHGAPEDVVAAHLARTEPGEDPRLTLRLVEAAERALDRGAPTVARSLLDRAAEELGTPADLRLRLVVAAGTAAQRLGHHEVAVGHWSAALRLDPEPLGRARRLLEIGDAHNTAGMVEEARGAYRDAMTILDEASSSADHVQERRLLVARLAGVRWLIGEAERLGAEELQAVLAQPPERDTYGDRTLLAQASIEMAVVGENAELCGDIAERAIGGGALLAEDTVDGAALYLATGGLNAAERDAVALRVLDDAVADARVRGSLHGYATAVYCRGYVHANRGRLRLAQADMEAALAMRAHGWSSYVAAAQAVLAEVLVGLGDLDGADRVAAEAPVEEHQPALLRAIALRAPGAAAAGRGRHAEALEHFLLAVDLADDFAPGPMWNASLTGAVEAAVALGRTGLAVQLARTAEARARRFGARRTLGRTLRAVAAAYEGEAGERRLAEAVDLLRGHEARYELARALVDLAERGVRGGAVGTARQATVVDLAQEALIWANRIGAVPTAERATAVLVRCGIRPDSGAAPAVARLTPSELRVCRLAARGMTNRQIAEHLFVTIKAVEWHLSHAYPKLGVTSRAGLAEALGEDALEAVS